MSAPACFQCAYCFEWNDSFVDPGGAREQSYVEDCQVCCRPNVLRVNFHLESGEALVYAEFEG
ncbi:MAG: CPXCG motif-containing cysteine-rich protein [Myxococcota bacterium]